MKKHLCCHQILDGQNFEHCLRRTAYLYDGAGSDSGFLPLYPQQPRGFHRGACPLQPDLDRLHRRGLRLLHPGAHVPDLIRDKFTGKAHTALLVAIDGLILLMAIFVFTIGGFKLAVSASREFSALLGIPRSLVYSIAPISGVFIVLAQIINIYEDVTGEKVESKEGADK